MNVLIIEDELPAARQLSKLLQQQPFQVKVLEILDSVQASVKWLRHFSAPELIFMDIQIADGLSFDIFRQVTITSPVIFTTAFDQYAIQAFRVNALDYLLKPIDPEELSASLEKARAPRGLPPVDAQLLTQLLQRPTFKERFLIKSGAAWQPLPSAEIAYFRSEEGITFAHTLDGRRHIVEHPLDELEGLLDPKRFFRINRACVLQLEAVRKVHPYFSGRLKLDIHPLPPEDIFVSRQRVAEFRKWLGE
ncbi:MAG: response regulator transcription factor [Lewinellaceae bacterium]|nr:response regulator transcription factor [Lewinellaceae bacterium]